MQADRKSETGNFSVVLVGAMNPRIHHPYWYLHSGIITQAEAEAAVSGSVVLVDEMAQFKVAGFTISCYPHRWDISTTDFASRSRMVEIVVKTFDGKLPETPTQVIATNNDIVRLLPDTDVKRLLAQQVVKAGLGAAEIDVPDTGGLSFTFSRGGDSTTVRVNPSPNGPNSLTIAVNVNHSVAGITGPTGGKFYLAPLVAKHVEDDYMKARYYADAIEGSLTRLAKGGIKMAFAIPPTLANEQAAICWSAESPETTSKPGYDKRSDTLAATQSPFIPQCTSTRGDDRDLMERLEERMEIHFRYIGRADGPYGTPQGRRKEYEFWKGAGAAGSMWLIAQGGSLRRQWGIADLLSATGSVSVRPVIAALGQNLDEEKAAMLLSALAGMNPEAVEPHYGSAHNVIEKYLSHEDDAIRTKAVAATAVLSASDALQLLHDAHDREADEDVLLAISDEIEQRS